MKHVLYAWKDNTNFKNIECDVIEHVAVHLFDRIVLLRTRNFQ